MKIKLVFDDWLDKDNKPLNVEERINLEIRQYHCGTIFDAELYISKEEADWLKKQIEKGFIPQFKIWKL